MDCFGTYFTHVRACDATRVQNATEWTASIHISHMSKLVMFVVVVVVVVVVGYSPTQGPREVVRFYYHTFLAHEHILNATQPQPDVSSTCTHLDATQLMWGLGGCFWVEWGGAGGMLTFLALVHIFNSRFYTTT